MRWDASTAADSVEKMVGERVAYWESRWVGEREKPMAVKMAACSGDLLADWMVFPSAVYSVGSMAVWTAV